MTYRIEHRPGGYNVWVGQDRREIYPMQDGRWFVLGWAHVFYRTRDDAAQAVADALGKVTP